VRDAAFSGADGDSRMMGRVWRVAIDTGNQHYQEIVRRLPLTMPTLDRAALDRAITDLGATPETVTEEQILHALREAVFPILASHADGATVQTTPVGLITTDVEGRVRSITPTAALLVGLPADAAVIGQLVAAVPELDCCVPSVAALGSADADMMRSEECIIPADGRRVQSISHLHRGADGRVCGVSVTVQDITLRTALDAEIGTHYHASETRVQELTALAEIARLVALATSLDATLAAITERTTRLIGCRATAIFLPDASGRLQLMGQFGLPDDYAPTIGAYIQGTPQMPDAMQPPTTLAFRDRVPVHRSLIDIPPDAPQAVLATRLAGMTGGWASIVAVPLVAQGVAIGTLTCYLAQREPPTDETLRFITTIADQAAIAVQNSTLHAETRRQLGEMTALHQSAAILNSSLDRAAVLTTIVEQAAEVTGARACALLELSGTGDGMIPRASIGTDMLPFPHMPILRYGPALYAIEHRTAVIVRNTDNAATMPWWREEMAGFIKPTPFKALIAVPFGFQGTYNATLMLVYDHPIDPGPSELQLIATFADHAAVAMHNAQLYEQAQQAAALEERHRLARDLHDSVTQSLFSMSLLAQVLPTLWEQQPEEARRSLEELRRLTKEALAEMRALLFQLRPVALEEDGLVEALQKHIESLQRRDGPALAFTALGGDERLPLPVEEALFRVASEAVSNALKHAHAKTIDVTLDTRDGVATLTVRDDGRGFDPVGLHTRPGHLGLPGMRERATHIEGRLEIASAPGAGTTVTCRAAIPVTRPT